ncbi:MAG: hypothetical protein AB8I08_10100 [Sandaracinaceae bacterium]
MYEEGVTQYFTAKRMAAKRLFGRGGQKRLRFRPRDLPSNGEIQEALLELAALREGDDRLERLGEMRAIALDVMRALAAFEPRLIGSVATGHIRLGSDIDIQLFSDDPDAPEAWLRAHAWDYEREDVFIRRPGGPCTYQHLRLDRVIPSSSRSTTAWRFVIDREAAPTACRCRDSPFAKSPPSWRSAPRDDIPLRSVRRRQSAGAACEPRRGGHGTLLPSGAPLPAPR